MKRPLGFNSRIGFPSGMMAVVLAGCLAPARAAGPTPTTNSQGLAITDTEGAPGSVKAPRQHTVQNRASSSTALASARRPTHPRPAPRDEYNHDEIAALRERLDHQEQWLAAQQQQIAKLIATVDELKGLPNRYLEVSYESGLAPIGEEVAAILPRHDLLPAVKGGESLASPPTASPDVGELSHLPPFASLQPLIPIHNASLAPAAGFVPQTSSSPLSAQATQELTQPYTTRLNTLTKQVEGISKGIAGFRFSGDLRLRGDGIFRSSNPIAGPEQNVRGEYRARLNFDKGIDKQLDVHFQVGSGRFDNALTDETNMAGGAVRGPIFLSEAWVNYHPNSSLNFQGGKMPEVFQDYSRFLWDQDVRFSGFRQSLGTSPGDNPLGITRIDFMAGQYILTNPNIQVLPTAQQCTATPPQTITSLPATITTPATLPAACAYLQAGYKPGENVRAADLFDQGFFLKGRIKPGWSHYLFTNVALFRNPNQIALTSTLAGLPLLVNNVTGVTLAGPLTGTGTATTIPGGGIYTASHFQIGHLAYRITKEGWRLRNEEFPLFLDVQASRNFGTSFLRNAWMATLDAGEIRKAGDVRFLYFYSVKDANSMISQFTDDHLGTYSGVNIRVHSIRFDLGLASFLQWQNIFYIQNEISRNDPARHFYVPVQEGTPTQYRFVSSLFVDF